jgi:hypothetical protein
VKLDNSGYPTELAAGIRCGNHGRYERVYHDSVETVGYCYSTSYEQEAQAEADAAAELAYERHLEDKGWQEAAAHRDWEASRGIF